MKKYLCTILAIFLLVNIVGCTVEDPENLINRVDFAEDKTPDATVPTSSATIIPSDIPEATIIPSDIPDATIVPSDIPDATKTPSAKPTVTIKPTQKPSPIKTQEPKPTYTDPDECIHNFEVLSFEDSTCAKAGKKVSYCAKCGTKITETVVKKITHTGGTATCQQEAVCIVCGDSYGEFAQHKWNEATCQEPQKCRVCYVTQGTTEEHFCANPTDDCTMADYCDTCGITIREAKTEHDFVVNCNTNAYCRNCSVISSTIGPRSHNYSSSTGLCTYCGAKNPNYVDTSKVKISFVMTSFPVLISYGTIQSASYSISGNDLILYINMQRSGLGGNKSLKAYYRISDPNFKTVDTGSYSTSEMSNGSSTTVTVTISGVIKSSGTYQVFLSSTKPMY